MKQKKSIIGSIKSFFMEKKAKKIKEIEENEKLENEKIQKIVEKVQWKETQFFDWWSNKKMIRFWVFWLLIVLIWYFSYKVLNIIFLIISAYIVSIIIESFILTFQKWHLTRWFAIFLSYFIFIIILLLIVIIVIPFLFHQLSEILSIWLSYISKLQVQVSENWLYSVLMDMERIPDSLREYIVSVMSDQNTMKTIQDAVQSNLNGIIDWWKTSISRIWTFLISFVSWFTWFLMNFILFLVLCILFSVEKDLVTDFIAKIWWDTQIALNRLKIQKIYSKLAVRFRSRLFISLLLAIAMWISLVIMWRFWVDFPWKVWLSLLAWLLDLIPYVWPIITWVLLFAIWLLYNSFWVAVVVVLILWLINVIENNIRAPLFMNKSLWVSAVLIFISMIIWGLIMWFFGVLLSVPIAVILTIIFQSRHKLETDDLLQIDKQALKEEEQELKSFSDDEQKILKDININQDKHKE